MSSPSFSAKSVARVNSKIGEKCFFQLTARCANTNSFFTDFVGLARGLCRKDGTARGLKCARLKLQAYVIHEEYISK